MKRIRSISDEPLLLVCRQGLGEFFLKTKLVDKVFEVKKGQASTYQNVLQELQKEKIHVVFVPHQSLRTHLFVRQIQADHKIGYKTWWNSYFFDSRISRDPGLPDALRQLSLLTPSDPEIEYLIRRYRHSREAYKLQASGQMSPPPSWASPSVKNVLVADKSNWGRFLEKSGLSEKRDRPWVPIFPGSVWATKRWTEEGFAEVARSLIDRGFEVLYMGAPDERDLCQNIMQRVNAGINLAGQTSIYESALILAHSKAVLGNDSASMHLASCAETPLVSLFGPTVIEFGYRPWGDRAYVIQDSELPCRPCGPHGHRVCPVGTHYCMKHLSSKKVLAGLDEILY